MSFTLKIVQPHFESSKKCSIVTIYECSHDAVFKICRLEFRFENLPQKMCRFRVHWRPIRHIFNRFQNVPVPASCVRMLKGWQDIKAMTLATTLFNSGDAQRYSKVYSSAVYRCWLELCIPTIFCNLVQTSWFIFDSRQKPAN